MRVQAFPSKKGQSKVYAVDGSVVAAELNTSVLTAVWTIDSGSATITSQSLANNVTSATIETTSEGCALIKVLVTFADSAHITPHFFKIQTLDPVCVQSSTGRY